MKFNSVLLLGAVLACTGLMISIYYIPSTSPFVTDNHLSIQSKFLEPPTQLPQQISFMEFNYSALITSLTNQNMSIDISSNIVTSYEQLLHIDKTQFITVSDPAISITLPMILNYSMNPSNHNEVWNDLSSIYYWVQTCIQYQNDSLPLVDHGASNISTSPVDMWQHPSQTIFLGQGDCEDQALLLTSLLLNYYEEAFYFECLLLQSSTGAGHVTPYIPVKGDYLTIIDPATGYSTITESNNRVLATESIEHEIANYLAFLSTQSIGQWKVVGAFSSNFDRMFSSTDEFNHWLLLRMSKS
jgi:hypothetical protein